ncbi:MAG: ABC transporter ATP-binding protein [Bacillota bacterium]
MSIYLERVTKNYRSGWTLGPLDLAIEEGEIFGFLGPNGAGKTTTGKLLTGLLRPSSGIVRVFGENPVNNIAVKQKIGYVTEDNILYPYLTPAQLVDVIRPYYPSWDDKFVRASLERFAIPPQQKIATFSAGMRQELEIILALAPRPALLILDDPTSRCDPVRQQQFLSLLLENKDEKQTIFLSSHRLNEVERIADRVGIIKDGKLLAVKSLEEIKTTEKKVRVVFQKEPPENLGALPGVAKVERVRDSFFLTVNENLSGVLEELKKHPLFALEVIDQNLEQVFFEYFTEGKKRNEGNV